MTAKLLKTRAIVRLAAEDTEEDVRAFLQGLVTNDVAGALPVYAALLTPQGKMLFDFLVFDGGEGSLVLDCEANAADDLARRLSLYRLRRKIAISRDDRLSVLWSREGFDGSAPDPRHEQLGFRSIGAASDGSPEGDEEYLAHRLSLGIPEGRDEMADILWLETNAAELGGVSFEKGCYVGQENTARMNWRGKVNRRLVAVPIAQSDPARQKAAYPDHGIAIDHLRVSDIDAEGLPDWQAAGLTRDG
ncbi:YgfZ/GcvT domain-containing protein [Qipengyuania nanhaisediminis]|uniref:CAF17-like 4Fe-4S cluster assembly/insertion protein YgfZ n=1 Tax=Qipengyuania nanhaisediminis TaxID=604088 RepID=UPI0038B2C2F0